MSALRLAIFDVDGTLVDSQHHIVFAMHSAFAGCNLPLPARADILSIIGLSLDHAMMRLTSGITAPIADLVSGYKDAYRDLHSGGDGADSLFPLYPGVCAALKELRDIPDLVLGIATGKSRAGVRTMIAAHNWDFWVTTQVADDHPSKPHPSMILQALADTGVDKNHTVMIGDTIYDMQMARAAGVRSIGVSWGYHAVSQLIPLADALVSDTRDLRDKIVRLTG